MTDIVRLDNLVRAAVPTATGVSVGSWGDRSSWAAQWPTDYNPSEDERALAQDILSGFEPRGE